MELANQTVKKDNDKISYKILDENGVDVTSNLPKDAKVEIETNSDKLTHSKNGEVASTLGAGESAFLKVVVKDKENKVLAESQRVTIDVKAVSKLDKFGSEWTLGEANFEDEDYKAVTSIGLESTANLTLSFVDQYGEAIELGTGKVEYTSVSTDVAIIDKETGKVTPVKEGTSLIRATLKDSEGKTLDTKEVEVKVTAKAELASISLDKDEAKLTVGGKDEVVKVKAEDQFGGVASLSGLEAESSKDSVATVEVDDETGAVTIKPVAKGSATVTITLGKFTKTVEVTVAEVGTIVDYSIEGAETELTTKDVTATTTKDETQMELSVYGKDAAGLLATSPSKASFIVTDKDGKKIAEAAASTTPFKISSNVAAYKAGETYTVTAKVGSLTVGTKTFKIVDNGIAPKLTFDKIKFESTDAADTVLKALQESITGKATDSKATVTITGAKYVSDATTIIATNNVNTTAQKDGTANLHLSEITVNVTGADKKEENGIFTINVSGKSIAFVSTAKATKAAQDAVAALFEDDTKAALADGVDAETIAAAQELVDAVADKDAKAALQADIDAAQDLLNPDSAE